MSGILKEVETREGGPGFPILDVFQNMEKTAGCRKIRFILTAVRREVTRRLPKGMAATY